jgi:hypothetical protein
MGGFVEYVATFISDTKQALSTTKCNVTASSKTVGEAIVKRWKEKGIMIHFALRVKALGVGLGAGVRRNATVMRTRLTNYMARVTRFKRLRKVESIPQGWSGLACGLSHIATPLWAYRVVYSGHRGKPRGPRRRQELAREGRILT